MNHLRTARLEGPSLGRPGTRHDSTIGINRRIGALLSAAVRHLDEARTLINIEGLEEEAESLNTAIADLEWQRGELTRR